MCFVMMSSMINWHDVSHYFQHYVFIEMSGCINDWTCNPFPGRWPLMSLKFPLVGWWKWRGVWCPTREKTTGHWWCRWYTVFRPQSTYFSQKDSKLSVTSDTSCLWTFVDWAQLIVFGLLEPPNFRIPSVFDELGGSQAYRKLLKKLDLCMVVYPTAKLRSQLLLAGQIDST